MAGETACLFQIMTTLDWIVMIATIIAIPSFGLWRGRGGTTTSHYLLAGKTMPWYAMGLSIMATQASAITFIATTGQAYVDGMRFVQFYFGLPIAMVILSATAVPIFHKAGVYTAYEYLERRFDAKTRALAGIVFLIERGAAVGIALYAPAIVMSVIFGWNDTMTTFLIGSICVLYTILGGIPAVTWTDVLQMSIIFAGLILALITVVALMPHSVSFTDAVYLAGAVGKLNAVDTRFDWNNRYNIWSGLLGATFLMLGYFGGDQSQVQRYLSGKSVAQSKLSMLFNAMAKVPMQFFILFVGAMVFVFYLFAQPPLLFEKTAMQAIRSQPEYSEVQSKFDAAWRKREQAAENLNASRKRDNATNLQASTEAYRAAQHEVEAARQAGATLFETSQKKGRFNDTNYIFLSFVTTYFPAGVIGLVIAVILNATMSSSSGELNSLATVTVMDLYRRLLRPQETDRHYLIVSRVSTAVWGVWAVTFAQYAKNRGSLVEAINEIGSYFYGILLGVFILAFFFKRVGGSAAFWSMLVGEAAIVACSRFTQIAYLWYNVIGALVVVVAGLLFSLGSDARPPVVHQTDRGVHA
ncbi:MAG TPA: sodium:solute symporter [Bryobacteraceae bacterium]|nr:sodium:solute symporter [Bryobacteraceae bacterium]